jgi:hypothetical protein
VIFTSFTDEVSKMSAVILGAYRKPGIGTLIRVKTISNIIIKNGDFLVTSEGYPIQIKSLEFADENSCSDSLIHPGTATFSLNGGSLSRISDNDIIIKISEERFRELMIPFSKLEAPFKQASFNVFGSKPLIRRSESPPSITRCESPSPVSYPLSKIAIIVDPPFLDLNSIKNLPSEISLKSISKYSVQWIAKQRQLQFLTDEMLVTPLMIVTAITKLISYDGLSFDNVDTESFQKSLTDTFLSLYSKRCLK